MADESTTTNDEINPLSVMSEEDISLLKELADKAAAAKEERLQDQLQQLAQSIEAKFAKRKASRAPKDQQMLESMRMVLGSAAKALPTGNRRSRSPDRPFSASGNGTRPPEHNIVKTKTDIAIAQSINIQFGGGDKNWDIVASGNPVDEFGNPMDPVAAARAADAMEAVIAAQLDCCKYGFQSRQSIEDRVNLGTAVQKGPKNALVQTKRYRSQISPTTNKAIPVAEMQQVKYPSVVRVNPWFFYPDDTVNDIKDAEDTIEVHLLSKIKLAGLVKSEDSGFYKFRNSILEILSEGGPREFSFSDAFTQFVTLTESTSAFRGKYLVLEYHGPVHKDVLLGLGQEPTYETPDDMYMAEVWVCQGRIIRLELEVLDGTYEVPYAVCVWEKDPSCIHGISLPMFLSDQQKVINITYRMLLDNASISSGPQVVINRELIEPAETDNWSLTPDKIWFSTELGDGDVNKAVSFFVPPNVTNQLQAILQMAKAFAEEESGIPLLAAGLNSPEVLDSASGAVIQQHSATIMSDYKNEIWDDCITEKVIRWMHDWNWEYNPRTDIRGEFDIDVKSSSDYRNKQIHIKNLEKLSVEASQNPAMGAILNMPEVQRARISMMTLPATNLVKSDDQIAQEEEQRRQEAAQHPDPELLKLQIEQQKVQIQQQQLALEAQKIQMEYSVKQQEALWSHQEKMGANMARLREAEAQVLANQALLELEYVKLAEKDQQHRDKILADLYKNNLQDRTQKFLAGIEQTNKLREAALQERELKLAEKKGSGALSTV